MLLLSFNPWWWTFLMRKLCKISQLMKSLKAWCFSVSYLLVAKGHKTGGAICCCLWWVNFVEIDVEVAELHWWLPPRHGIEEFFIFILCVVSITDGVHVSSDDTDSSSSVNKKQSLLVLGISWMLESDRLSWSEFVLGAIPELRSRRIVLVVVSGRGEAFKLCWMGVSWPLPWIWCSAEVMGHGIVARRKRQHTTYRHVWRMTMVFVLL